MLAFPSEMSVQFPSCSLPFHLSYVHAHATCGNWQNRPFLLGAPQDFDSRVPGQKPKQVSLVATYSTCLLLPASGSEKCEDLVISQNHTCCSWFPKTWRAVPNLLVSICYDKSADIIATWSELKLSNYIKNVSQMFLWKKKTKKNLCGALILPILH